MVKRGRGGRRAEQIDEEGRGRFKMRVVAIDEEVGGGGADRRRGGGGYL